MLHRNTLIAVCALFCAIAVGAGLFVANLSKQSGLITQQASTDTPGLPTNIAGAEPTPLADDPSATSAPAPTSAPIAALDPAEPTTTSRPAPTNGIPTEGGTPAATAAPTDDAATSYIEYTVQKGDLLNSIAKKYNVTAKDILAINEIGNPDSLTVGQVLRIPKV
jgi:LysM repeat protein